jgi:hypothetical protein
MMYDGSSFQCSGGPKQPFSGIDAELIIGTFIVNLIEPSGLRTIHFLKSSVGYTNPE